MPSILIPLSGTKGLTPTYSGFPAKESSRFNLDPSGDNQMYADGIINPFRTPGFLSPACDSVQTLTAATAYSGIIQATQVDEVNSIIYAFERSANPDIYTFSSFTATAANITAGITATAGMGTDFEIYSVNGVRALFFTYKQTGGGGGEMGMYNFSSFNARFLSTTATNGFNLNSDANHRMVKSDNGIMYILDGNYVHDFDGTLNGGVNGTGLFRHLQFPQPYQISDGVDGLGFIWLAISGTTRDIFGTDQGTTAEIPCSVIPWNRQDTSFKIGNAIPVPGAKEIRVIFWYESVPWIFTLSANRTTEIRKYDGRQFSTQFELHRDAIPRFHDSVQVRGRLVYWLGQGDGIIYVMGRVTRDSKIGLYKLGDMSTKISGETFSSGGAIAIAGGEPGVTSGDYEEPETIIANFSTGSTENYARRFFPHSRTITGLTLNSHQGDFRSVVTLLPKLSELKGITLFYPQLTTGSSDALSLQVFKNRSSNIAQTATITQTDGQRGWFYMPLSEHNVNAVQLGIRYSTAVVVGSQIEPEYAEIDYEPTEKLR